MKIQRLVNFFQIDPKHLQSLYNIGVVYAEDLKQADKAFQEILKTVLETERKASSIADLSQMQLEGSEKMVKAVDEIAKVADDNAASTEEVSAATEQQLAAMQDMALATKELTQLAVELLTVVERFQVGTGERRQG